MNVKYFIILFITLFTFSQTPKTPKNVKSIKSNERNGFEIIIKTKNLDKEKFLLQFVYDTKKIKYIADSVSVKSNEDKVVLKNDKRLVGGIYYLKLKSQKNSIELAIDNGCKINLLLESKDINELKVLDNKLNLDFINFQKEEKKLTVEQQILERKSIIKKYPNSVLSYYFQIENKVSEKYPDDINARNKYRLNYFNTVSKTDKRLFLLPNVFKLLNHFVNIYPMSNENYIDNINFILKDLDCKTKNYEIFLKWFSSNLVFNEVNNLDATFIELYGKYISNEKCKVFSESELNEFRIKQEGIMKLPIGSQVPELTLVDKDKKEHTLSKIYPENDFTFIVFFSPTCEHCKTNVPKVRLFLNQMKQKYPQNKCQFISVLNDTNPSEWEDFINKSGLDKDWLNLKSSDTNLQYQEHFNAYSNPAYILVDKKGKVVLKSFNNKSIDEIFSKRGV